MEEHQLDLDLLSEEEANALKQVPPIGDEPETTPDEEKVEIVEPSPPEKKIEELPKEPPLVKVEEPPPVVKEEKPPTIDGIIAKDGKNFIPFSVLEEERTKRQDAETRRQQLEAEVAELKKPKPAEPVKEPEPVKKVEVPPPIDFKAMGKKLYDSEDGAAEVLQQIFEAGKKAGEQSGATAAKSTSMELDFKKEVERIKGANPWIAGDPIVEGVLFNRALQIMDERKIPQDDLGGMVKAAEDAVAEGRKKFRVDDPKIDLQVEIDKAVKAAVEKNTKEVLAKFNIKEPDAVTLANVRNLNPEITSKFDEIDTKVGIDFEEAYGLLTPEERDAYLRRTA